MIVPHSRRAEHHRSQEPVSAKAVGVVVAAGTTVLAAAVSSLFTKGASADLGDLTAVGVVIAVAAAFGGFVVARVIGRQGKG